MGANEVQVLCCRCPSSYFTGRLLVARLSGHCSVFNTEKNKNRGNCSVTVYGIVNGCDISFHHMQQKSNILHKHPYFHFNRQVDTCASCVIDGPGDFPDPLDDSDYQTPLVATSGRLRESFQVSSKRFWSAAWMGDTHRFTFFTKGGEGGDLSAAA